MPDSVRSVGADEDINNTNRADATAHASRTQENPFFHSNSEIIHALFGPSVGPCLGDFSCHYHRHRGRLYASSNAVSFYSQLFGFERKLCLYVQDIVEMEAYRSTSVRILTVDSEEHIFRSFYNRDLVVQLLHQLKSAGTVTFLPPSDAAPATTAADRQEEEEEEQIDLVGEPSPPSPPIIERPGTPIQSQSFVSSLRESGKKLSMRSKSLSCLDNETVDAAVSFPTTESEISSVGTPENLLDAWQEILNSSADFKETGLDGLELSCSLTEFFDLFLADNAPFSLGSYQEKVIGDYELKTTPWAEDGATRTRTISFRHPISKTFGMGPSSIFTTSYQRMRSFGQYGTCIETSSVIEGIPASDCFTVEDQWILQPRNGSSGGMTLSVKYDVRFTKRTLLKKMIQKSTKQETTEWYKGYAGMLQSSLQSQGQATKGRRDVALEDVVVSPNIQYIKWGPLQKAIAGALVLTILALLIAVFALLIYVIRIHKVLTSLQDEIVQLRFDNTGFAKQARQALASSTYSICKDTSQPTHRVDNT